MVAVRAHEGLLDPHLDTVPVPEPGPDDALVKVAAAGISPGMLRVLALGRLRHLPTTLGAEAAGTIARIGSSVEGFAVGDRVRLHPSLTCGRCVYCCTNRDMMCARQAIMGHGAFGITHRYLLSDTLQAFRGIQTRDAETPMWMVIATADSPNESGSGHE